MNSININNLIQVGDETLAELYKAKRMLEYTIEHPFKITTLKGIKKRKALEAQLLKTRLAVKVYSKKLESTSVEPLKSFAHMFLMDDMSAHLKTTEPEVMLKEILWAINIVEHRQESLYQLVQDS